MSSYELNRAIHHIYIDRDSTMRFRAGDTSVLEGYGLDDAERKALAEKDFPRLWALDVHPVLLFHLSAVLYPREWYLKEVVPAIQGVPNRWYDYYSTAQDAAQR